MLTLTWTQIAVAVVILLAIGYCLGIWVERDSGPLLDDGRFAVKRSAPAGLILPKPTAIPRARNSLPTSNPESPAKNPFVESAKKSVR